ncbi:MAG TPA: peptidylprolyl isomerase [Bacteroidales bacterium]|nr:peptidylprolyl isomerase [Bacteroidales bacterium]HPZ03658.1 peptidylprolyl isomerase [Bacteroidales bacterium]HQB75259.1 peptidylprolyl isomerase [Bacteroidales bacterium]
MKKHWLFIILFCFVSITYAQKQEPILFQYGKDVVTVKEFVNAYNKNNDISKATEEELQEYLDLYVNFKLKVKQGYEDGIDTSDAFLKELASYRTQSAQQYLIDKEVTKALLEEAISRAQFHVRASHILINCPATAAPADTLAAYKKIMDIRSKIIKGKISFFDAAVEYSDDPSARDTYNEYTKRWQYGNRGELGYFTVFDLIYPFENRAYNTAVGNISMPIRSNFGYHIIYVQDKVPAVSKITAKQIFVTDTLARKGEMSPEVKTKIDEIYRQLKSGKPFGEVAKELSEDQATKDKEGALEPFQANRRPGNFVQQCLKTKQGDFTSEPVSSVLGWHILKIENIEYVNPNTDHSINYIRNKIGRDQRSHKSKESLVKKLKKEYKYKDKNKKKAFQFLVDNIPANYFSNPDTTDLSKLNGIDKLPPLFTYADQVETVADFAAFISRFQGMEFHGDLFYFLNERFPYYVQDKILAYENRNLENKYPEFKELVTEYREGMILFEINTIKVWNEAIRDTVGIMEFYETIKDEYNKPFDEIKAIIITEYQNELERRWIEELKQKYPVIINEEQFKSIINK